MFVGGGTPSLIGASRLGAVLAAIRATFGLAEGAEVTTEANPESTSPEFFAALVDAGFTRVSLGMQSAAPHVLRVLERRHTPGRAVDAAREARAAGLAHVNLDLIYATPGETDADLAASLDAVLAAGVDHVSAYALIVEDGTAFARRVPAASCPPPTTTSPPPATRCSTTGSPPRVCAGTRCRTGPRRTRRRVGTTWATGSTATGGGWAPARTRTSRATRWWNVKHPARYAAVLAAGESPAAGRETLTDAERHTERVMLRLRLASGLPLDLLDVDGRRAAERAVADGLLAWAADDRAGPRPRGVAAGGAARWRSPAAGGGARVVLTRRGRLLADAVVRDLLVPAPAVP